MSDVPALELRGVSFSYGGPWVLQDVDLVVEQREFLGLVGPNGGGKSTLLKIVLGLLAPVDGRVAVLGKTPAEARTVLGYVPQFITFPRDFPISVQDAVLLGRLGSTRALFGYRADDRSRAKQAMRETEILDLRARRLGSLSGGQLQRVLIARALVGEPRILILDEPTANVDVRIESDIFALLRQLNQRMTIVVVSHDIGFISQYVTRVACLNRTLVCHRASAVTGDLIQRLYGAPVHAIDHTHAAP